MSAADSQPPAEDGTPSTVDSTRPVADSVPRIQIQQPLRKALADAEDRNPYCDTRQRDANDWDANDRAVEARQWASEQNAAPIAEEPPPTSATDRDVEVRALPPATAGASQPAASQRRSNLQSKIRRLPSVFAPPPLAAHDVGRVQLRAAKSHSAPAPSASRPAAIATSPAADQPHPPIASRPPQSAVVGLAVPPREAPAEESTSLWQRVVRFPKPFKKPSREPPLREPLPTLAKHADAAEVEHDKGNWFSSFGKGLMKAPPPPQWMQDRMAKENRPAAGGE